MAQPAVALLFALSIPGSGLPRPNLLVLVANYHIS
jgi:hypothetical protein